MLERILLDPEQQELLSQLVEAARKVPREQREKFFLSKTNMGDFLHHKGFSSGNIEVYAGDLEILVPKGLLNLSYGSRGTELYNVTPEGFAHYAYLKQRSGQPPERVSTEVRHYLQAEPFRGKYPSPYKKWEDAEQLLWQSDSQSQLTTIGHLCREAVQEFASLLVKQHKPPNPDTDVQHTVARIRSVLAHRKDQLGSVDKPFLDALVAYWGTVSDLIQRQEHGGQKEGEPLSWEDARRVVFQTGVVMFEIDHSLEKEL